MKKPFPHLVLLLVVVFACGCALAACSSSLAQESSSADSADGGASSGTEFESTAMVVAYGDGDLLFFDQENDGPYAPGLENAEIIGLDGAPMRPQDLTSGNIVRVTGDGIMLESYPGQYPGITKVEVIEEGSPSDADRYDEVIAQIWQPRDPTEPAHATLEYATDLAAVALFPLTCGYEWSYEKDGEVSTVSVDAATPVQYAVDDLPDARIESSLNATVSFDITPMDVSVVRWEEVAVEKAAQEAGSAQGVDEASVASESVDVQLADGRASFAIEPGWRYEIDAQFKQGSVGYAFVALQPR